MARTKKTAETEAGKTMLSSSMGKKNVYDVTLWFIQPLLGSAPSDPNLYKTFIASKAPDAPTREEELVTTTVENVASRGTNVFLRRSVTGKPTIAQHALKGFLKERGTQENRVIDGISITNHKTKIVGNVVIKPTFIDLNIPEELIRDTTEETFKKEGFGYSSAIRFPAEPGSRFRRIMLPTCDRPLQAETPQGKITSIASSEVAPAGTSINFQMEVDQLAPTKKDPGQIDERLIALLLSGVRHGTGQWRGSGEYGAFVTEVRNEDGKLIYENTTEVLGTNSDDADFYQKLCDYIDDNCL